ncbi:nucleotide-diphospho-sugar transferase [Bacteroides fragilis]|uniref:glycosyltransferase family 2 protein n=1 Tax=Bacteroides fragilis TaxID=817 RepID=UPI00202F6887|nr:nucleotide-diphospho-sugar transferase [Bacteroides fragilis]MCM0207719.1 nucleotide-diphospho-sugar transferase [Bacteroides fragilis]MCM0303054.1 nucleotide-diphospho-sugar transferase [Bacteroides fragilis]
MKTAVLFLVFNRPDTTIRVFETIRQARPPRLYVAADGPRKDRVGENEKCEETRSIIKQIDWNCEVKTLFRNENLGCGKAVSQAITWFFQQEEEGIILEDDVLPHPDFFPYCEELLERYRNIEQVRFISGRNHLYGERASEDSYYFSSVNQVWGWASWSRVWKLYDYNLKTIKKRDFYASLNYYYQDIRIVNHRKLLFAQMKRKMIDTWDYQLTFALMVNRSLCIIPNINLIQNIGIGNEATHTLDGNKMIEEYKGCSILPLKHPDKVKLNKEGDMLEFALNQIGVSHYRYIRWHLLYWIRSFFQKVKFVFGL